MEEKRKELGLVLFSIQILTELVTSTLVVLFRIFSEYQDTIYVVYICVTIPRVGYWMWLSWKLAGSFMLDCLIMMDSLLVLGMTMCFVFVGYNTMTEFKYRGLEISEMICFFILILSYNCVFRAMIKRMQWTKARTLIYKANRMYAILFYMIYAIFEIRRIVHEKLEEIKDMYLAYIFTSMVYLSDVYLIINERDKAREMDTMYVIGEGEEHHETDKGLHTHLTH